MDFRTRDVTIGGGQVNLGSGNVNVGRDAIDNRVGVLASGNVAVTPASDLEALGSALAGVGLSEAERAEATSELDALRTATSGARPDRNKAGDLRRFTALLRDAGALAGAGAALVEPLTRIAG